MVVEDNLILRQLTSRMLAKLGAKVEARCDGQDAVNEVRDSRRDGRTFDLILMDCQVGSVFSWVIILGTHGLSGGFSYIYIFKTTYVYIYISLPLFYLVLLDCQVD
jgi:hypothetical protein